MRSFVLVSAVAVLLNTSSVLACAWPDNWLGPPDNNYRALTIGVFYHAAVLHDLADGEGRFPLEPPAGSGIGAADQEALREHWLAELAALPETQQETQDTELERVKAELAQAARFYWRNSRFNCAIDYDYHVDSRPRLRSEIADGEAPWFRPVDIAYYGDVRGQYDGLLQIMVLYVYDEASGGLKRVKGGGGWTWGASLDENKCGWSWWAACTADNACGSDWLVVHEFGHQLDSLFHESGHPEVWFNHLAPLEANVARFGEHFDANSYILRRIPEDDWLDLRWGELRQYPDADGDHVPDPDDWLLAHRLAVDPDRHVIDADGDGMDDWAELLAANGNRYGHGERLYPALKLCDPLDADTDRDGVPDGCDALPMLPMPEYIPQAEAEAPDETSRVAFLGTPDQLNLSCAMAYYRDYHEDDEQQDGRLLLELQWGDPALAQAEYELKLMLDLDNDGWFSGTDNYRLLLDAGGVKEVVRHDAGSHEKWPFEDKEAIAATEVKALQAVPDATYAHGWCLTLDRGLFPELAAKPGEMLGLNIGIRKVGWPWFYMLGEPNTLVPLELR